MQQWSEKNYEFLPWKMPSPEDLEKGSKTPDRECHTGRNKQIARVVL